jgi:cyclophilin family peptidyl-prolyl cis-trans isomerase/protein-disulfide isomerase
MRKELFALITVLLALGLVLAACGPSTPTDEPTEEPTDAPATDEVESTEPVDVTPVPVDAECRSMPPVTEEDWTIGPDDAPITIVEYADFQCPGCARFEMDLDQFLQAHEDEIRFVFRHFPLPYHDKAVITSEAAEAAGAQGAFWEMHDLLYARYDEWSQIPTEEMMEALVGYAEELALDVEQFTDDLENHVYQDKVEAAYEAADALRVPGTPAFIINGRMYPFGLGLSPEGLELFIDAVLEAPEPYDSPPEQVIDPDQRHLATVRTENGDFVIELYTEQAPVNVNSFAFLAQEGLYDDVRFIQVVTDTVALTGDPTNTGLIMDHGYWCDLENDPGLSFDEAGMVGLNSATRRTTSNQFFITLSPQPDFDEGYMVIGQVVEGMDVVESLTPRNNRNPDAPPGELIETIIIEAQ